MILGMKLAAFFLLLVNIIMIDSLQGFKFFSMLQFTILYFLHLLLCYYFPISSILPYNFLDYSFSTSLILLLNIFNIASQLFRYCFTTSLILLSTFRYNYITSLILLLNFLDIALQLL